MKLKNICPEVLDWSEYAISRMNDLLDTDINELNVLALPRILSICTSLSVGVVSQKLKESNKTSVDEQIKYFYDNI